MTPVDWFVALTGLSLMGSALWVRHIEEQALIRIRRRSRFK